MSTPRTRDASFEREVHGWSGWVLLLVNIAIVIGAIAFFIGTIHAASLRELTPFAVVMRILAALIWFVGGLISFGGHFALQPNEARVLILFGAYKGTVRRSGFYWANPFYSRSRGKIPLQNTAPSGHGQTKGTAVGSPTGGIVYQFLSTKISLRAHNF